MTDNRVIEILPNAKRKIILEMSVFWVIFGICYLISCFTIGINSSGQLNPGIFVVMVMFGLVGPFARYFLEKRERNQIQITSDFLSGPSLHSSSRSAISISELNPTIPPSRSLYDKLCNQTIVCNLDGTKKIKICHFAFDDAKRGEIFNNINSRMRV